MNTTLLRSLLAIPVLGALLPLGAQTAPAPSPNAAAAAETAIKLEAFTVTGSNVKRLEVEKVLPVTIFDAAAMEVRDPGQPSDLITALPQVTGLPGNETATLGATARGDNASVSLRGIPSSNTLVLLNGRRLVPHPISQSEAGVPTLSTNINQLPNRGLERVEVLRDGASSVYGSDAVAGVINYSMQRNFKGTELALRYGVTDYGDGTEYRGTLTHGLTFARNRGRAIVTADYYLRDPIYARDRSFSADGDNSARAPAPWQQGDTTAAGAFNARSATTPFGNFLLGTVTATNAFGAVSGFAGSRPAGVPATMAATSGLFVLTPTATGVGFAPAAPIRTGITRDFYWNNNAYRVIQPKTARTNVHAAAELDLNDRVTAFADFTLYRAHSVTYREPDGITQSTDGFIIVPVTNPWNPFGNRFWSPTGAPNADGTARLTGTPSAVSITNKRLGDLATRTDYVDTALYRGVAGLRGKLLDTWSWEAAVLWAQGRVTENEEGPTRKSLLIQAINQTEPGRAFNPFTRTFAVQNGQLVVTGPYVNPESVQSTFRSSFVRSGITKLGSADFRASGDVVRLWGGNAVGAAFGGEFRYEAYDDFRPPFAGLNPAESGLDPVANDFLGFSPNSDTHGNRHVAALYAEAVVPLVGRNFQLPLVRSLELSASARYESYTDFGETTKPKLGVNWRPFDWAMVRASYNEGFHAPNLAQLFTGTLIRTVTGSTDTYRSTVTGLITDGPSNRRSVASGNRDLQPEVARGKSAGVVIEVPGVRGLSVSVDYWEIRQRDVIASGGGIADDTAALLAATQSALAAGQTLGQIDLGSGTGAYKGDPSVLRLPVTQADRDAFAAYNATRAPGNQRAVVGAIDILRTSYFNKAQQFVNGFDFDVSYRFPQLSVGQFRTNTTWTYLNDFHAYSLPPGDSRRARANYRDGNSVNAGGATPIWRGSTNLTWKRGDWGAGLGWYYTGSFTDVNITTTKATWDSLGNPGYIRPVLNNGSLSYRFIVKASSSYNLFVTHRLKLPGNWLHHTNVRLGVNNLFNTEPPLSGDSRGYEPSVYNVMARGRTYALQLTRKF